MTTSPKPLSIKKNMLWNSFGSVCNLGCAWLITVFIVRFSNNFEAAGLYALAMSIYGIFAPVAQFRTYVYQISDLDQEHSVGEYLAFRLLTCFLALFLLCGYVVITNQSDAFIVIFLYSIYKLASLMIDVFHATEQKHKRMDYLGISELLQGVISLVVFLLVFINTQNLSTTLFIMFLSMIAIGLFYDLRKVRLLATVHFGISFQKARKLFIKCLPIVLAGMAAAAAPNLPRQALSQMMGTEALGVYGTLAAPVALIQTGASYIYNPLLTYYCQAFKEKNLAEFKRLSLITILGIVGICVACSLVVLFLGEPLLVAIYGQSIAGYLYLLQPLILCATITGFMWFLNDLTQALRNYSATFWGNIVSLVLSLAFMIPMIQVFQLNGVTATNIITSLCAGLFMLLRLRPFVKKNFGENNG